MNKVSSINLGGYPFTIDEDAYDYLRQYLDAIRRHFREVEGNEEITSDIEARLAELFQASLGNRPIVTLKDVRDAVAIMGAPEDFGAAPMDETPREKFNLKTGKRLFRNPEEEVIGGVCSGIAAYLGIQDPLWVRLFFVVVALSGGFGVPLYLVLWAIMPKPKTASDWLAMRGEPINFSNIGRIIQEEVERISGKISEFGEELGGVKKKSGTNGKDSFKEGMDAVGSAVRHAGESMKYVWKPILYVFGVMLVLFFAIAWIGAATGVFFAYPFLDYLVPGKTGMAFLGLASIFLIVGIPFISLLLLISRLLFGTRVSTAWQTSLGVLWGASITGLFILGSIFGSQFSAGGQYTASRGTFKGDTLYITAMDYKPADTWYNIDNEIVLADNQMMIHDARLSIVKGEGTEFELIKQVDSRGESNSEATQLASMVTTEARFEGNQLKLSPWYSITKGQKWRVQEITYVLKVPEGKFVKMTEGDAWSMVNDLKMANDDISFWDNPNQLWKMSAAGLACTDCPAASDEGLSYEDFNTINISGKVKVLIERGDEYQVELRGSEQNREKVSIQEADGQLSVKAAGEITGSPVQVRLTLPVLKAVNVDATDDVQIKGFTDDLQLYARGGGYEVKVYGDVNALRLKQEGENKVDIVGNCELLEAELNAGARLDAEKPGVREAAINVSINSRADVVVREKLSQKKDDSSRIRVKGNPTVVNL